MCDQLSDRGPSGVALAMARYGTPLVVEQDFTVSQKTLSERRGLEDGRTAEVLLLVRRLSGRYLLHTKAFYPEGAFRLLTGGIHPSEDLIEAAMREAVEETGLAVQPERFLAVLRLCFRHGDDKAFFTSYLMELAETGGELGAQDDGEEITEYREVELQDLLTIAEDLEHLPPDWAEWGVFRAFGHRLAARILLGESVA
jgi:8-oxo-dGTP pyrophosphatase MutT (NUDIX family)